jgi:hypothetical protein
MYSIFRQKFILMAALFVFLSGCGNKGNVVTYRSIAIKPPIIFGEIIITTVLKMGLKDIADHYAITQQNVEEAGISFVDLSWNDAPPDIKKYCSEVTANFSSKYVDKKPDPRAHQLIINMKAEPKDALALIKSVLSLFNAFEIQNDEYREKIMRDLGNGKEVRIPITSASLKGYVSFAYGAKDKPSEFDAQVRFAEVGDFFPVPHQ